MTSHTGRLYGLALALVVFFLAWAVLAARPWAGAAADPRLRALAAREVRLRHEAKLVNRLVATRWKAYKAALRLRETQIAAATACRCAATRAAAAVQSTPAAAAASSAVRVVTLPPLTITRTS